MQLFTIITLTRILFKHFLQIYYKSYNEHQFYNFCVKKRQRFLNMKNFC